MSAHGHGPAPCRKWDSGERSRSGNDLTRDNGRTRRLIHCNGWIGTSLGIRVVNAEGNAFGNDAAIDRLRILDVTPQLDKSFGAATVPEHGSTTLTFTVTNTTELAARNGWSFSDTLPTGLVANPASVSTNCPSGTMSATPGTVSVAGNLGAGQASCTASVQVSATGPGTYTNCAGNVTSAFVNAPGCASVSFNAEPRPAAGGPYAGQEGTAVQVRRPRGASTGSRTWMRERPARSATPRRRRPRSPVPMTGSTGWFCRRATGSTRR